VNEALLTQRRSRQLDARAGNGGAAGAADGFDTAALDTGLAAAALEATTAQGASARSQTWDSALAQG
jgi:hypothetical protein